MNHKVLHLTSILLAVHILTIVWAQENAYTNYTQDNQTQYQNNYYNSYAVTQPYTCLYYYYYYFPDGSCTTECPLYTTTPIYNPYLDRILCYPCYGGCSYCTDCCNSTNSNQVYDSTFNGTSTCYYSDLNQQAGNESIVQIYTGYSDVVGGVITSQLTAIQILQAGTSTVAPIILQINLIKSVRYLNINYSPRLTAVFSAQVSKSVSFDFGPAFPDSLEDDARRYVPPPRFARYHLSGLFIVNFWREITTSCLIAIAVGLLVYVIKKDIKNEWVQRVLHIIKTFLLWNYILNYWMSNTDEIILYILMEYQNLEINSAFAVFSFLFNLVCFAGSLVLVVYIPHKIYIIRKNRYFESRKEKEKAYAPIKVLFEDAKDKVFLQEIAIFIIIVRAMLNSFVIAAMDSPKLQGALLLILNLSMLFYLYQFRPFNEAWKNIELGLYEVLMFIVHLTCVNLALKSSEAQFKNNDATNVILACGFIEYFAVLLFRAFEIRVLVRDIWPYIKLLATKIKARYFGKKGAKGTQKDTAKPEKQTEDIEKGVTCEVKVDKPNPNEERGDKAYAIEQGVSSKQFAPHAGDSIEFDIVVKKGDEGKHKNAMRDILSAASTLMTSDVDSRNEFNQSLKSIDKNQEKDPKVDDAVKAEEESKHNNSSGNGIGTNVQSKSSDSNRSSKNTSLNQVKSIPEDPREFDVAEDEKEKTKTRSINALQPTINDHIDKIDASLNVPDEMQDHDNMIHSYIKK